MSNSDQSIFVTQSDAGQWLAMTNSSPYFCVEAETELEVRKVAARAQAFYRRAWVKRQVS